jgi:RNA-splicing ligase RtcB
MMDAVTTLLTWLLGLTSHSEAEISCVHNFDERRADALRDEAPGAYKDVGRVMRAQSELTRIVRRLEPVPSYKGAGP